MRLFHCLPVSSVSYGVLTPDPSFSDEDFRPAYRWAEAEVGFYPLFLGLGPSDSDEGDRKSVV